MRPASGSASGAPMDPRTYWVWVSVALLFHIPVDMFTSILASRAVGAEEEVNPIIRVMLEQGIVALVAAHIVALVLAGYLFYWLLQMVQTTPTPYARYFAIVVEIWLVMIIMVGVIVFINNLTVVTSGYSPL